MPGFAPLMKRPTVGESAPKAQPSPVRTASTGPFAGPALSPTAYPRLQAKLNISVPGDPSEQEADRVADAVTARAQSPVPAPPATPRSGGCASCGARPGACNCAGKQLTSTGSALVQRLAPPTAPTAPLPAGFAGRMAWAASGGGLSASLRADFEPRFGANLAGVRVHAGAEAAALAAAIGARAFTYGRDIFFGAGEYRPDDRQGRHLLAHELAHVFQQGGPAIKRQAAPSAAPAMTDAQIDEFLSQQSAVDASAEDQGSALAAAAGARPDLGPPDGIPIAERDRKTHWSSEAQRLQYINETLPVARFTSVAERETYLRLSQTLAQPKADPFPDLRLGRDKNAGLPRYVRTINFVVADFSQPVIRLDDTWTLQTTPDPSAGTNFDTYLYNGTRRSGVIGGRFIPAISLGGTRFRVLMGSAECPGCHFGQGLEVDLFGTHFVLIIMTMASAFAGIAIAGARPPVGLGPVRGPGPPPPVPRPPAGPPNLRVVPSPPRVPAPAPPAPGPVAAEPPQLGTGTFGAAPARAPAPAPAPAPVRAPLRVVQPNEVPTPATLPAPAGAPAPAAGPIPFTAPLFLGGGAQPAPTPAAASKPKPQPPGCPPGTHPIRWPLPIWVAQGVGDTGALSGLFDRPLLPVIARAPHARSRPPRDRKLIRQYVRLNIAVLQPLFAQGLRGAIHHKWPLFVSGPDIFDNLVFLTLPLHTLWHRQLAIQGRTGWMIRDPVGTLYCVL
jgi:uncharacterized protein DUF4157